MTEDIESNGRRRSESYSLDAASYQGGALDVCLSVGEIHIEPSTGSLVELEIVTEGDDARAVGATVTRASFHADGDRLVVGVWEAERGRGVGFFGQDSADVRVVLRVPPSGAYDASLANDVGDVRLSGLMLGTLDATTDVGTVFVTGVDLGGDATLTADVGDVILEALSVQSGNITLSSDVGNVEAALPPRADVGYDALATTDVGEAIVDIGETERSESSEDGAGAEASARSAGFASKPTKVVVHAIANVGDARITAR